MLVLGRSHSSDLFDMVSERMNIRYFTKCARNKSTKRNLLRSRACISEWCGVVYMKEERARCQNMHVMTLFLVFIVRMQKWLSFYPHTHKPFAL